MLTLSGLFPGASLAIECGFTKAYSENVTIPVVGSGMATAGEDVPVGKVLYRQDYWNNTLDTNYQCKVTEQDMDEGLYHSMNTYTRTEVISTPSGVATSINGKDVFPTNVKGIGVVFYLSGPTQKISKFPDLWQMTYPLAPGTIGQDLGQLTGVTMEFIKTGHIPPGMQSVSGSSLPEFQVTTGSHSPFEVSNIFVRLNFSGNNIIHTKTCQLTTLNIEVNMDSHWITGFNGPGSVTPWKSFDIVLKNCPPFYGYSDYTYIQKVDYLFGTSEENKVTINFRSSNGVVDGNPLLARINEGPVAAKGVGIELSQLNASESIALDGSGSLSLSDLSKTDNSTYTIPLKARYVQTDTKVEAGTANGSVVFTITYL
ncbi:TPA: type 1 fimbrial protein [Klebsiella oxytoca]|nr:type 1 fimbrial protein [Klebsiella oxytoca]